MLATLLALSAASFLEPRPGPPTADQTIWKRPEYKNEREAFDALDNPKIPDAVKRFRDIANFYGESPLAAEIVIRRNGDLGSSYLRCVHQAAEHWAIITMLDEVGRPRERWLCPTHDEAFEHADLDRGLIFRCPTDNIDRFSERQIFGINVIPYRGQTPHFPPDIFPIPSETIDGQTYFGTAARDHDDGWPKTQEQRFPKHVVADRWYIVQAPSSGEIGRCSEKYELLEPWVKVNPVPQTSTPQPRQAHWTPLDIPPGTKRFHEVVTYEIRYIQRPLPVLMAKDDLPPASQPGRPPLKPDSTSDRPSWLPQLNLPNFHLAAEPGRPPLKSASPTDQPSWQPPTTLPGFQLKDSAGKDASDAHISSHTLLVFWTHWSSANTALFQELAEIRAAFPMLKIVPVSIWAQDPAFPKEVLAKHGFTQPTLLDGEELARACRVTIAPTLVLVDPVRKILHTTSWRERISTRPIVAELTKLLVDK